MSDFSMTRNNNSSSTNNVKTEEQPKHLVRKVRVCTDLSLDVVKDGLSGVASMITVWSARTKLSSERDYKRMLVEQYDEEQKFLEEVQKSKYIQEGEKPEDFLERIHKELLG